MNGERLKELAELAGTNLNQLSQEIGATPIYLYQIANGKRTAGKDVTERISIALASKLGRKPSEVYAELTGIDEPQPLEPEANR